MNIITKEQIIAVKDDNELYNLFIDSNNTISDDTQEIVLLQCIKFGRLFVLESLSKNIEFKKNILDEIIEYPDMVRRVIMSNGMGGILSQLSNKQLLKLFDNLISLSKYDEVWTHLYQKTFKSKNFKDNPNKIKFILDYFITEKKHYYFSNPQIIMNVVGNMDNITPEIIEWLKVIYKNVDNIILNFLYKRGDKVDKKILECIYFNVRYKSIERKIATLVIERNIDSPILIDYYTKTGDEKYLPNIAKDIFTF